MRIRGWWWRRMGRKKKPSASLDGACRCADMTAARPREGTA
jgi:hypothetical protein